MEHVGIYGLGAIGSLVTKYLNSNTKNKYYYFNRSEKNEIKISFKDEMSSIQVELSSAENQNLDWLIICLKEYHIKSTLPNISKLINDKTKVAIFQNGINLSSPYLRLTKRANILETIIDCSVQSNGPSQYLQLRKPVVTLRDNPLAKEFIKLFKNKEIEFNKTFNFLEEQWVKLIESSSIGAIQSYTGQTCVIFKQEKYIEEYKALVNEGIQVASSEGVLVNPFLTEQLLAKLKAYPDSKGSSMLEDKLAGRELELDAKIGAIVSIAKKNSVDIPNTKRLYKILAVTD